MGIGAGMKFGNLISKADRRNESALKSDLLLDAWQPGPNIGPGARLVIGSFIDFRACRHA